MLIDFANLGWVGQERVEAVRKTVQEERVRAKEESAAVENFLGKILDENQELQQQVSSSDQITISSFSCVFVLALIC